eukprot:376427_1
MLRLFALAFLCRQCISWFKDISGDQWECQVDNNWLNGFDAPMTAERDGFFIAGQESYHDNGPEDRRFKWDYCRANDPNTDYSYPMTVTQLADTAYDAEWIQVCGPNTAISRVDSWHDNDKEDRQYRIYCKELQPQFALKSCSFTGGWRNNYDGPLDYKCDGVMTGIHSVHDNGREDRLYDFLCCGMTLTPMGLSATIDFERLLTTIKSDYSNNRRNTYSFGWGKPKWYQPYLTSNVVQTTYILTHTQGTTSFWNRVCPTNGALRSITMKENTDEFDFECSTLINEIKIDSCYWTDYINEFFASFEASCNEDGPIRGIQSYHSPSANDRRFKIYCCKLTRGVYTKGHEIEIALQTDSALGAETQITITLDLCWNNDQYQAISIPNTIDTWFNQVDVVKYGECGNDRELMISIATNVDDDVTITSVKVIDESQPYLASSFKDCITTSNCTQKEAFTLNTLTSDVVIRFPDDYVTSCADTTGCLAELYNLNGYQQYFITITPCGSYVGTDGIPAIGVVLRGLNGNLDKSILTGPNFDELPVGEGNIGDLLHISIEYESGPDFCIEQVTVFDPYNEPHIFGKDFFGDGTIISQSCINDGNFRLLSAIQYVPCYDKPFSIKTYETSVYTSVQIHACSGDDGGIIADNSALLTMTITGFTKNDKFINTEAYLLKSAQNWDAGDSRDFTLPISGEFNKISLVSISNNHPTDALCVDSVLINGIDAFLTHYWVGLGQEHDALQTIPAVLEWPICDVELTTIIQAESPLPVDPDTVATSTCVNSNRLISVECQISQTFQTYREISWEHQTGQEISTEVAMESGTETSTSLGWSTSAKAGVEIGDEKVSGKFTAEVTAGLSGEDSYAFSSSLSVANGQTSLDVTTDGKVNGETIAIECSGSVTVPPNQQVQYSMLIEQSEAELTTITDIKMTKCSAYLYPDSYKDPHNYVYITGIEGKLQVKDATNCYVSFSQATQVSSHGLTCGQERALATREWGTFVPLCDPDDYDKYQKCQCSYGDTRTLATCGCVDETTGNLLQTATAAVVPETEKWNNWCEQNCNGVNYNVNKTNLNVTETIIIETTTYAKMEEKNIEGEQNGEMSQTIWYLFLVVFLLITVTYIINSCIGCWRKPKNNTQYRAVDTVDTDVTV